ncbi:peptidoglycan binding domain-containing protein [Lactiplantibacillus sp. WILCCON 0030]|uniref:Peptidoglycan binding domain-containing protein n=1 Tax=Lactiplantibacillus brownii TaxID=3069269 RepID=A0ABU1A7X2_9LACO|nr:peptidoglycan binding domain-containing protein [Lactiplantibacillus brownii]MDQ7936440.1 peptidoglycan binding domain-containing protein [Lactiplantibacillus brownii]
MKHKRGLSIAGGVVGLIAIGYIATSLVWQHQQTFLTNTQVAGINVSGQTAAQAAPKVSRALEHRTYHITENGKKLYSFNSQSAGITIKSKKELTKLVKCQNYWRWPLALMQSAHAAETTNIGQLQVSQASMAQLLTNITHTANQTSRTTTENAKLVYQNNQVEIKKEIQGTQISQPKLKQLVGQALASGQTTIDLQKAYVTPTVTSTSQQLKTAQTKTQKYATETASYNINGHKFEIPHATILSWLNVDRAGKVSLKQAAVKAYVDQLDAKYHTYHTTRTFKSTQRGTVKISGGLYGWTIQTAAETTALSKDILAGKDFSRSPLISGSGYHNDQKDIGDTYIEVDKQAQHMWVYVNGQVKVSTDVVTGTPGKHETTTGVWSIWNKERNSTLKGDNDDGSGYSQPVAYWLPFDDTGQGIHDSPWQKQYGGTWYKSHGSHGCVNTPPATMAKVYHAIPVGTPIVIF